MQKDWLEKLKQQDKDWGTGKVDFEFLRKNVYLTYYQLKWSKVLNQFYLAAKA